MLGSRHYVHRARREAYWAVGIAGGIAAVRLVFVAMADRPTPERPVWTIVVGVLWSSFLIWLFLVHRRWYTPIRRPHDDATTNALAHRGAVETGLGGNRSWTLLDFEKDALAVSWKFAFTTELVPYSDILSIHERRTCIELRFADDTVRVFPETYRGRQDLLWAFAIHCNDAVERGIDLDAADERDARRVAAASAVPPHRDEPPARSGVSGFGSALADGAGRNHAPPRKSGLGVGLFPPQP